jgi:hypothetical protein
MKRVSEISCLDFSWHPRLIRVLHATVLLEDHIWTILIDTRLTLYHIRLLRFSETAVLQLDLRLFLL